MSTVMENKYTNIKERVLYIAQYKGIAKTNFLQSIGMTYGSFKGVAKKGTLNSDAIVQILTNYPDINPDWLLSGEGEMLRPEESHSVENKTALLSDKATSFDDTDMYAMLLAHNKGARYFDHYASAGLISGITDGRTQPDAVILVPGLDDCNFAINVYGDSMYPKYCAGEIVMCREMIIDPLLTYIRFGEAYVVVLDDGTVLKYVQPGDDRDHLTFESENKHFRPYQVHKSRIRSMYLVKGVITRKNF